MVLLGDEVVVATDAWMDGVLGKLEDGDANWCWWSRMVRWWGSSSSRA
jgi:hypothetical protein